MQLQADLIARAVVPACAGSVHACQQCAYALIGRGSGGRVVLANGLAVKASAVRSNSIMSQRVRDACARALGSEAATVQGRVRSCGVG